MDPRDRPKSGGQALTATLEKNAKGFGFLIFDDREFEDLYIPAETAEKYLHGDRLEVTIRPNGQVTNFKTIGHQSSQVFGRVLAEHQNDHEQGVWIASYRRGGLLEVYCPDGALGAKVDEWVKGKLEFHDEDDGPHKMTAKITEVIGPTLPASRDVELIAAEFGLEAEPSDGARKVALEFPSELSEPDFKGRVDLRNVPFITIDGETARDFDDAIHVEREAGGFILWVAIADVSHYVVPGNALDSDALSRGTSVYFPERAFHMLPRELSENLCSLKPQVPRLAMTAKMRFDGSGRRKKTEIMDSVIFSRRRATYTEIHAESQKHGKDPGWEFAPHFELFRLLKTLKTQRGCIDFDLPETVILVGPDGEPTQTKKAARLDSHMLIEEFMIAANEAVTEWAMERKAPFIYRVHEEPSAESFEKFMTIAKAAGFTLKAPDNLKDPKSLAGIVKQIASHPASSLLNGALLRSMRQAKYSSEHGIHYGLASKAYTHFTSPIRRYPDLIVHRQLGMLTRDGTKAFANKEDRKKMEDDLYKAAVHCSYRERLANSAERAVKRIKEIRMMTQHLGAEFAGTVGGMTDRGMYVQIGNENPDDPFLEGFVPRDSLQDDRYEFNPDKLLYYGRRAKRTFRVGNKVTIRVVRADVERREIEFEIIDTVAKPLRK